ncbi:peroxisomal biogenesis factor 11-domain-containing protein [Entophlyctis helioformis]|nr:peroxisomal biogenesis factor 11-domain-containing protein [Entophlyctis helioformis]
MGINPAEQAAQPSTQQQHNQQQQQPKQQTLQPHARPPAPATNHREPPPGLVPLLVSLDSIDNLTGMSSAPRGSSPTGQPSASAAGSFGSGPIRSPSPTAGPLKQQHLTASGAVSASSSSVMQAASSPLLRKAFGGTMAVNYNSGSALGLKSSVAGPSTIATGSSSSSSNRSGGSASDGAGLGNPSPSSPLGQGRPSSPLASPGTNPGANPGTNPGPSPGTTGAPNSKMGSKSNGKPSRAQAGLSRLLGLPRALLQSLLFRAMVFRKILLLNDGRDKVLKCFQYTAKVLLWCLITDAKRFPGSHTRASIIASQFSTTRKIIRLGHWLEPLNDHLALAKDGYVKLSPSMSVSDKTIRVLAPLAAWLGIINDISDDIVCVGKLGLVDKAWVKWATPISDRLWYASIFIDLHEAANGLRKLRYAMQQTTDAVERAKIQAKVTMQYVTLAKLSMDFVFCSVDVFELGDRVSDGWQAVTGFAAAILGTYKLYVKHK